MTVNKSYQANAVGDYVKDHRLTQVSPKVAIYIRWSTEDQGKSWTKEVQLEACKKLILNRGWNIDESLIFVDDGKTGANMDRPGLTALRQAVIDGKIQTVVSYKLDRLSRSVPDAATLVVKEWNNSVLFISSTEMEFDTSTLAGRNALYVLAMVAENERENIRTRTMAGKRKNAENGINPGKNTPYGYTCKDGIYGIDPETAPVVKSIFTKALTTGLSTIANELNHQGTKSPRGNGWSQQGIKYILENKFYMGIMTYGKTSRNNTRKQDKSQPSRINNEHFIEDPKDNIPQIIDSGLWEAAQAAKEQRNVNKTGICGRTLNSPYLLTGIAYCTCGSKLKMRIRKKCDKSYYYYRCRAAQDKGSSFCNGGYIPMEKADKYVLSHLDTQLLDADSRQEVLDMMLADNRNQVEIKQNLIRDLEKDIRDREAVMTGLDNEYKDRFRKPEEERLTTGDYNRMMSQERDKLASLENQLQVANSELNKMLAVLDDTGKMEKYIEEYSQFDKLSANRQKALLRELLAKVIIYAPKGASEPEYEIVPKYLNQ